MNIEDLCNKMYGGNILREGENINNIFQSIEQEQMADYFNLDNHDENNNQIKF